MELEFVGTNLK